MKTLSTQIIYFLRQRPSRMNIANLLRFLVVLALLITAYSVLFHLYHGAGRGAASRGCPASTGP
ncbi:MAG: hypothetical protein V9H69_19765 [Anaerolineae bacterium]